jgi:hypothetical protein
MIMEVDIENYSPMAVEPWHEKNPRNRSPWNEDKIDRSFLFNRILVPLLRLIIRVYFKICYPVTI